jgi:hypothetical protein
MGCLPAVLQPAGKGGWSCDVGFNAAPGRLPALSLILEPRLG